MERHSKPGDRAFAALSEALIGPKLRIPTDRVHVTALQVWALSRLIGLEARTRPLDGARVVDCERATIPRPRSARTQTSTATAFQVI